jgi:regulator of sigma E protease
MVTLLVFLLILSILVLIHEAGHFFVAKKFGIKVEEFGFGIPPRLWGKKIGETIYSINWLPIGGFVKLFGEDEAGGGSIKIRNPKSQRDLGSEIRKEDLDRAFFAKSVWQRAAVVVAGVAMNALLAFVIYYVFLGLSGFRTAIPRYTDYNFFLVNQKIKLEALVITGVLSDSPASKAGLKPCEEKNKKPAYCLRLISINGQKPKNSDEFKSLVAQNAGKETTFVLEESVKKQTITAVMIPRANPPKGQGALGIKFDTQESIVLSYDTPLQRVFSGISHPFNMMGYQFHILSKLITFSIANKTVEPVGSAFSGPVGIGVVTGEILKIADSKERLLGLLNLAGLLSVSLAFFNVLPIPALDGGRLFFILVEGIFKKKISAQREAVIHTVGMAVLIGFFILITFKDIFQFFVK